MGEVVEADFERKSMSKSLRFEVMKRDGFVCRYCGATPMGTRLEVDHIEPVSKGGTNDPSNLVTACFECNRGKSDRKLSDRRLPATSPQLLEEHQEQIAAYSKQAARLHEAKQQATQNLINLWFQIVCPDQESFDGGLRRVLGSFSKKYPMDLLIDAMYATQSCRSNNDVSRLRYFCGCVRNMRREA